MVTIWVIAFHTVIHLVALHLLITGYITKTEPLFFSLNPYSFERIGSALFLTAILSTVFVILGSAFSIKTKEKSCNIIVGLFQITLSAGTIVYVTFLAQVLRALKFH
ncbi:MAG: hypothetical protein AAF492_02365 [Verrucomicrobiota bacterium]